MRLLLRGGRLVDPASRADATSDVLVDDGRVAEVGPGLEAAGAEVVDCDGLVVCPGLVDLHAHLREPGREDAETIETGSRAAALGGYTAVCPMPNTDPVADNAGVVEMVAARGREVGLVDLFPVGAVTLGQRGAELAELGAMARSAARVDCFSDDGRPLREARLLRLALEYARAFDAVIADHAEDASLTDGAQMHEGEVSAMLGLAGWPAAAEVMVVARDLLLAELTGGRLHLCHVSTGGAVELVRAAKARGVRVTAEAAPHHFSLTDEAARSYDPVFKVNPPLREKTDVEAVRLGLADGTLDAIATDHAPHAREDKEVEWATAPPGMLGLETALAVTLTELVGDPGPPARDPGPPAHDPAPPARRPPVGERSAAGEGVPGAVHRAGLPGYLDLPTAIERLTSGPARCRRIPGHGGPVAPGAPANLAVFDPAAGWTVDRAKLASRARNTPFHGRALRGRVVHTLLRGAFTVRDGRATR
ncbi:MAG TPA: dihydroorotase [Actinomycetota bacterium]|nr:dihydroorotase [Actinomycetota bacterium]